MGVGRHAVAVGFDLEKRIGGQEAVAADLLAADHALEQAGAAAGVDLVEGASPGQRVADQAAVDGHQLGPLGQLLKRLGSRDNAAEAEVAVMEGPCRPVRGISCNGCSVGPPP